MANLNSALLSGTEDLPEGEVLIQVHYSSLNYKDALSASGNRGVTRNYPHTPGIDASGIVAASTNPDFKAGDPVVVTSYDLGMNTDGGFGEYIRVPAAWVLPLPESLSLQEAMIYGTAGFTAAQSFWELTDCWMQTRKWSSFGDWCRWWSWFHCSEIIAEWWI